MDSSVGWAAFVLIVAPIVLSIAGVVVAIWVSYEVIWRGVRRGLREFYADPHLPRNRPRAW